MSDYFGRPTQQQLIAYQFELAELRNLNRPDLDREGRHRRAWLRRLLWNVRAIAAANER